MRRLRSLSTVSLAVLPALPLGALPGHAAEVALHRPARPGWVMEQSLHFGQPGNASGYSTVLLTDGHLWVFGGTNPGGQSSPVIEHLAGRRWVTARLPTGLSDFISDASAPGSRDIWAVSSYGRYVLRWDGTRWRLLRRWRRAGSISGIVATSPRNAWVFGTSSAGYRVLGAWHYDGRSWRRVLGAADNIYRASAVSGRDVWGIEASQRGDAILHFNGRRWQRLRAGRAISAIRWHDILAESSRNVWLAGNEPARDRDRLVLAHWNGERWISVVTRISALAGQLASAGPDRVLVTATSSALLPTGLVILATSAGRIAGSAIISSLGNGVSDAVLDRSTDAIWASGGTLTRLGGDAAVWMRSQAPARVTADAR
jgi:hypothetical protein